jgi:hypothetical protein
MRNPCKDCKPPQRHAYCHCEGQCAKGDAYKIFVNECKELRIKRIFEIEANQRNKKVRPSETLSKLRQMG